MNEFISKIIETLNSNGFPDKKVSLPTEKMFEAADKRGFSFNKVIDELYKIHNIECKIGAEKIIFSSATQSQPSAEQSPADMMKQAQEMMAKMDPEELRKLQEMFMNMSPEEKEEIMKKGKDLGLL